MEIENTIPAVESFPEENVANKQIEAKLLDQGAVLAALTKRESNQRYYVKNIAVFVGCFVILAMLTILGLVLKNILCGRLSLDNSTFAVVIVAGPIVSITAITVALFVGAFRKFDEKDLDSIGSATAAGISLARGN